MHPNPHYLVSWISKLVWQMQEQLWCCSGGFSFFFFQIYIYIYVVVLWYWNVPTIVKESSIVGGQFLSRQFDSFKCKYCSLLGCTFRLSRCRAIYTRLHGVVSNRRPNNTYWCLLARTTKKVSCRLLKPNSLFQLEKKYLWDSSKVIRYIGQCRNNNKIKWVIRNRNSWWMWRFLSVFDRTNLFVWA